MFSVTLGTKTHYTHSHSFKISQKCLINIPVKSLLGLQHIGALSGVVSINLVLNHLDWFPGRL